MLRHLPLFLLCLACATGGFAVSAILGSDRIVSGLATWVPQVTAVLIAGLLLVLIGVWTGYSLTRRWAHKTLKTKTNLSETEMISGLVDHFTTPEGVSNPTPQDRQRAALVNLGLWLARREAVQFSFNATVTVVGGLVGAATLFLLYEQNQKFDVQNQRITLQTDANITQSVLIEGARRAALAGDLTTLLADIREVTGSSSRRPNCQDGPIPCWVVATENAPFGKRENLRLPDTLNESISSFLVRNTPYLLARSKGSELDFDAPLRDQFDFPTVSPERGQVLQALVRSKVALLGFDFSWAQLDGAELPATDLNAANLSYADFSGAVLSNAKIMSSNLRAANFENAVLFFARMDRSFLAGADFTGASLNSASLREVNLSQAILHETDLTDVDLRGANLFRAELVDTQLTGADFSGVDMSDTDMSGAWAWADDPPRGLSDTLMISLCVFPGDVAAVTPMMLERNVKPDPCVAPDT